MVPSEGTQLAKVFLLKNKSQEDSSQMFTACGEIARPTAPETNNHLSNLSQCKGDKCANEKHHSLASSSESHSWKEQWLTKQNHSGTANHTRLSPTLVPSRVTDRQVPAWGDPMYPYLGGKPEKLLMPRQQNDTAYTVSQLTSHSQETASTQRHSHTQSHNQIHNHAQ